MSSLFDRFRSLGREIQTATKSIHDSVLELRQAIAAQEAELELVRNGPLPVGEVIERFGQWVDATAAYQADKHAASLVAHCFGLAPGRTDGGAPWLPGTAVDWGWLCVFHGDTVKARFATLARTVEYTSGPPAAERPARLAQIETELAQLGAHEEALIDEAAVAGVKIEHRAAVIRRRADEQAQRDRTARVAAEENRPAREAEVDRRHGPRVARSAYIDQR